MKGLGALAVVAVIVQGVLGGTRVTQVSTVLAAVHGVVGQAFFGLMVVLCVLTGKGWRRPVERVADADHLRARALVLLAMVAVQIGLGSWLRHFGARAALACHAGLALAVWAHAGVYFGKVWKNRRSLGVLVPSALAVAALSSVQIVLGIVAMVFLLPFDGFPRPVSFYQAVVRTGHQTNGALLLAATVVLTLRAFHQVAGSTFDRPVAREKGMRERMEPAALDWEAVA
jgi:cytochrome c oxidase assembly protein subunit 15